MLPFCNDVAPVTDFFICYMESMQIRPERPDDCEAIHRLTRTAFAPMPFSRGDEADCVAKLRNDGDLALSLVATEGPQIVGHIAFSPAFLNEEFCGWYGLGPVSVWPHLQRRGIGRALIEYGLAELKRKDAFGCVLIGDPAYYSRFGFIGDGSRIMDRPCLLLTSLIL